MSAVWIIAYPGQEVGNPSASGEVVMETPGGVPIVKQVTVTKTNDIRREVTAWSNGTTSEVWFYKRYRLANQPPSANVFIKRSNGGGDMKGLFPDFGMLDFPEMGWLSLSYYKGISTHGGRPCYFFQREEMIDPAYGIRVPVMQAWIDVDSRRPVALNYGGKAQVYSYSEKIPQALALPEQFSNALDEYEKALAATERSPMKL